MSGPVKWLHADAPFLYIAGPAGLRRIHWPGPLGRAAVQES
jgi:hypothetical protein